MTARVLVVDDLLPNIRLLEAKLKSEYYDVLTAQSGKKAIEIAIEKQPDIILLDVMMPEMDGFEVCRRLKSHEKTSFIPIVMVTALGDKENRVEGLSAGADDFLTKPINDLALFARISSLVRLKNMFDELRLRGQTSNEFGLFDDGDDKNIHYIEKSQILVIDDDLAQSKRIKEVLEKISIKTDICNDISNVSSIIESKPYDLIIISTQISDIDSLRIASSIRNTKKTKNIPQIMIIDEDDTKTLVKGLDLGINDYLVIPIDGNELIARVKTQIKRKNFQDALRTSYQQSISMAIMDSLTNVYNRHYFDIHVDNMLKHSKEKDKDLSLMIIDIDHFKYINDNYGHQVGDQILRSISMKIVQNLRASDLTARYGGEEFVIVMPSTSSSQALHVAERIRSAIDKSIFKISKEDIEVRCTISIGAAYADDEDDGESLVKKADNALYRAKNNGRNQIVFF